MSSQPFFVEYCPHCKRNFRVFIQYLGQRISCRHCLQEFVAKDRQAESMALDLPICEWNHSDANSCARIVAEIDAARRPR